MHRSHRAGAPAATAISLLILFSLPAVAVAADPTTGTSASPSPSSTTVSPSPSTSTSDVTTGTDVTSGTDATSGIALTSIALPPPPPVLPHWSAWEPMSPSAWIRGLWARLRIGMTVSGRGSWYPTTRGYWGIPAVALPGSWYRPRGTANQHVRVCVGTRCQVVPVVDYCDCYVGTGHARVVDMSWALLRALGLSPLRGLYVVSLRLVG